LCLLFIVFTQTYNKSLHNIIWKLALKIMYNDIIVELAAYIAMCTFNKGAQALLQILFQAMQVQIKIERTCCRR